MPNVNTNSYHFVYIGLVTIVVAVSLSLAATGLKEKQDANVALATKTDILKAVNIIGDENIGSVYDESITELVVDYQGNEIKGTDISVLDIDVRKESKKPVEDRKLPLFIYKAKDGTRSYIMPVRGFGLWDEIWGYVAIAGDKNTIVGVAFDHAGETPGLGAEIKDDPNFGQQFVGKKINDKAGIYTSVSVVKGNPSDPDHEVRSISGATITSNGVSDMLKEDIKDYMAYLEKL